MMSNEKLSPISITIKSFQSIDDLQFKIEGFTCITGPSNIGKSAIIRAISGALLNNSVVGDVRKGQRYCSVVFKTDDYKFEWKKGEKVNQYTLNDNDRPLDKIGQNQIEFIESKGFRTIKTNSREFLPWLAPQFEPLFLFDQSGSVITDFFSSISRLDLIQNAITINNKERNRLTTEAKIKERSIESLKKKNESLNGIDQLIQLRDELIDQLSSIKDYEDKIKLIENLKNKIDQLNLKIKTIKDVDGIKIDDENIDQLLSQYELMVNFLNSMERNACRIIKFRGISSIKIPDSIDQEFEDFEKCVNYHQIIENLNQKINKLSSVISIPNLLISFDEINKLEGLLASINELKIKDRSLSEELSNNQKELDEIIEDINVIPLCPTCNRPTIHDH